MDSRVALDRWKKRWMFAQKTRQFTRKSMPTQTNHATAQPPRPYDPSLPAKQTNPTESSATSDAKKVERENLFTKKDTNADGFLSHPEFMSGQKDPEQAKERFIKFDTDGDGKPSRKEFVFSGKSSI